MEINLFSGRDVVVEGAVITFTEEESKRAYKALYKCDFIDEEDNPTDEFRKTAEDGTFVESFITKLPEGIPMRLTQRRSRCL